MVDVSDDKPQLTPLVIGLTRPPMMWGIPLNAFYIIVGVTLIAFLVTTSFWSALIAPFIYLALFRLLQPRHPHPRPRAGRRPPHAAHAEPAVLAHQLLWAMTMLNVVTEELGFGREQRRERPMATHIPYHAPCRRHRDRARERRDPLGHQAGRTVLPDGGPGRAQHARRRPEHHDPRARIQPLFAVVDRHSQGRSSRRSAARSRIRSATCSNKRYMAELRDKRMFTNELYLTIVRSGMRGALGAAETVSRLARSGLPAERSSSNACTSGSTNSRKSSATSFASSRNTARARSASPIATASPIRSPAPSSTRS